MSIHDGHRERMKKRFLQHGIDSFDDHTALELLLFFARARGDVNPMAHSLINKFGSISAVFDAPMEELVTVPGVGESTALLIKLIPQLSKRYLVSRTSGGKILNSTVAAGEFMLPYFYGEREEVVYMACLDAKCKVINCKLLFHGGVNTANINVRKLVESALMYNATSVILAHNHTSGVALPSQEDKDTTRRVEAALEAVDIVLTDHIIVADDDFVSMADNGFFVK